MRIMSIGNQNQTQNQNVNFGSFVTDGKKTTTFIEGMIQPYGETFTNFFVANPNTGKITEVLVLENEFAKVTSQPSYLSIAKAVDIKKASEMYRELKGLRNLKLSIKGKRERALEIIKRYLYSDPADMV